MRHHYFAKSNELLLDIDGKQSLDIYNQSLQTGDWESIIRNSIILKGNSQDHWHIFLTLNKNITPIDHQRMAIILGSDPKRESANVARYNDGATLPILLIRYSLSREIRKPDWSCDCPREWNGQKLRSCYHLRSFEPFHYVAGTLAHKVSP